MNATGKFTVECWQEADLGGSLSDKSFKKVDTIYNVTGEICGKLHVVYLMYYTDLVAMNPEDASAEYIGYLSFDGEIEGKKGTFVLEDCGVYENFSPSSIISIVKSSGTGGFEGVTGGGTYFSKEDEMHIELHYTFQG